MYGSLGDGRETVKMEPRKRRGYERCEKCKTNMEVHLTYHKCPVCGREQKKAGRTYKDRVADLGERPLSMMERLQKSMQAGSHVSGTPGSLEFMELEPSGWLRFERYFLYGWLLFGPLRFCLPFMMLDPLPMYSGWAGSFTLGWLPFVLLCITLAGVLHNHAPFRRAMILTSLLTGLACLAIASFGYLGFSQNFVAAYPALDHVLVFGTRHYRLLTMPGPAFWLLAHGVWFGVVAWHIFHEERELGRM